MKIDNKSNSNLNKVSNYGQAERSSNRHSQLPKQGDIIRGEIADIKHNQVTIKLSNGQTIEAKLTEQFEFYIGQKINFMVKDSSIDQLLLKPLLEEGSMSQNKLIQILENANMSVNEDNLKAVLKLIENQLPVDRESLSKFISLTKQHKDTDIDKLLFMIKNNIPVTKENINELELMEKGENKIIKNLASLSDDISSLIKSEDGSKIIKLLLNNNSSSTEIFNQISKYINSSDVSQSKIAGTISQLPINSILSKGEINIIQSELNSILKSLDINKSEVVSVNNDEGIQTSSANGSDVEQSNISNNKFINQSLDNIVKNDGNNTNINSNEIKNSSVLSNLNDFNIEDKNLGELFKLINKLDLPNNKQNNLNTLVAERITYSLLNKEMIMNKEHLKNPDELNKFYNKLYDKVLDILKLDISGEHSKLSDVIKETSNLKSSIEFMNNINNNFNFVQIPMMLNDKLLNSELYIFNNKRQLKNKKGTVTALIRLDLLNIGHLDIHVSKKEKNVDLKFYTEDNEKTKFLKNNFFKLHKILKEKGFNIIGINAMENVKEFNVVEDFFEKNKENHQDIKRYTFDMRA